MYVCMCVCMYVCMYVCTEYLLGVSASSLNEKLSTRVMESKWGGKTETTTMKLTVEQVTH